MTFDEVCALAEYQQFSSALLGALSEDAANDPTLNRANAEALAMQAWRLGWRPQHDPERVAEKIRILKLLHATGVD